MEHHVFWDVSMEPLLDVCPDELVLYNQGIPSIDLSATSPDADAFPSTPPTARPRTRHTAKQQKYRAKLYEQFDRLSETLRRVLCTCEVDKLWGPVDPTKAQLVDAATKHLQKSWSLLHNLRAENNDLVFRTEELQKLADCRDCPVMDLARTRRGIYDW